MAVSAQRDHLREAHGHLGALGLTMALPSLDACTTLGQCLEACAAAAAAERARPTGTRPFARLTAARVEGWVERRWPTMAELDAATGDTPCVVMSFCLHVAVANSAAMRAAGLGPGVTVAPHGVVVVDEASGLPTGELREQAAGRAWDAAPEWSAEARRASVLAAARSLHGMGYVEVHDLHAPEWLPDVLHDLDASDELPLRVRIYPPLSALERVHARRASFESARVRLAGGKVFADGTLNSRTAHMIHRYDLPIPNHPRGQCLVSPAAMDEAVRAADALGLHIAVHAIGDAAVRMVLDSVERVRPRTPGTRIEHAEVIDAMDVPRFARLGVSCSVQPCHLLADVEALRRYLPHRLNRVLPLRELLDSGLKPGVLADDGGEGADGSPGLVFGSDVPIVRADPEDSIQAAVHRRRAGEVESEMIAPKQAISEAEAWACLAAPM